VRLAPGAYLRWTGQYELLAQMEERMKILIPLALLIIVVLLYLQFKNFTEVLIVLLSVPFALVGSVWALFLLDYNSPPRCGWASSRWWASPRRPAW
jgi:Cu(I)/Ag(I) efflux system membrane protein CusA/SilA